MHSCRLHPAHAPEGSHTAWSHTAVHSDNYLLHRRNCNPRNRLYRSRRPCCCTAMRNTRLHTSSASYNWQARSYSSRPEFHLLCKTAAWSYSHRPSAYILPTAPWYKKHSQLPLPYQYPDWHPQDVHYGLCRIHNL